MISQIKIQLLANYFDDQFVKVIVPCLCEKKYWFYSKLCNWGFGLLLTQNKTFDNIAFCCVVVDIYQGFLMFCSPND